MLYGDTTFNPALKHRAMESLLKTNVNIISKPEYCGWRPLCKKGFSETREAYFLMRSI
jgi:hypothetical protein